MANRIGSFADLIAPVSEEEFFATYHDRQVLHVPAPDPDKFADVMSWDILTDMLNMTAIWSPASLRIVLDPALPGQDALAAPTVVEELHLVPFRAEARRQLPHVHTHEARQATGHACPARPLY